MNRRSLLAAASLALTPTIARAQPRARFADAAAYSADEDGVAFLVARNGVILAEDYANGGDPFTRAPIGAGARLFAPILIATLISNRLLTLDEPASLTIGAWGADPDKNQITVRGLLSGASGVAFGRNDERTLARALELPPQAPPGARYLDDAAACLILSEIARRKLEAAGKTADPSAYLMDETLLPIGCTPVDWSRSDDGALRLDDGARVTARAWAQVGELVRREGIWRARQLADAATLRLARQPTPVEPRAGMGLWLVNGAHNSDGLPLSSDLWRMNPLPPPDLAMAAGVGGQRLYILPTSQLVIVRLSRVAQTRSWSDARFLSLLSADL